MSRAALILALALVGCVESEEPRVGTCGAEGMQSLVGQSRDVLAAMTLPAGSRVIEPGSRITRDYRAERLNIDVDAEGRIARVWCG